MYGLLALVELWQIFLWLARRDTPAFGVRRRFIRVTESFKQEELASVQVIMPHQVLTKIQRHHYRRRMIVWKLSEANDLARAA
jgi:hypothetical protein